MSLRLATLLKAASSKPLAAFAIVAAVGVAAAAIAVTYTTTTTLNTGVTPPPVQFVAGSDAGPSALSNYVTSYALSANRTSLTASVKAVPEATLVVGSFFRLQNVDAAAPHVVTLSTPQATNAHVTAYTLQLYDGSDALQATLDLKAASPSATFTMPAASTYTARLTVTLASGAGADNVDFSTPLTLTTV